MTPLHQPKRVRNHRQHAVKKMLEDIMTNRTLLIAATILVAGCSTTAPPKDPTPKAAITMNTAAPLKQKITDTPAVPTVRVNGVAAIVNDDVITFKEVIREAQPALREAQKKEMRAAFRDFLSRKKVLT